MRRMNILYNGYTCPIADYHAIYGFWIQFMECFGTVGIEGEENA